MWGVLLYLLRRRAVSDYRPPPPVHNSPSPRVGRRLRLRGSRDRKAERPGGTTGPSNFVRWPTGPRPTSPFRVALLLNLVRVYTVVTRDPLFCFLSLQHVQQCTGNSYTANIPDNTVFGDILYICSIHRSDARLPRAHTQIHTYYRRIK